MSFHSLANKTHFPIKGFAPDLALKKTDRGKMCSSSTHPMEGHWKIPGGFPAKVLEASMKIKQNFLGGKGVQNKKPSVGGVWRFSGTAKMHKTARNLKFM